MFRDTSIATASSCWLIDAVSRATCNRTGNVFKFGTRPADVKMLVIRTTLPKVQVTHNIPTVVSYARVIVLAK
ncbi:MAG: hypothetical protein AMXMBFR58_37360 [Phycisphaerae bacterium]